MKKSYLLPCFLLIGLQITFPLAQAKTLIPFSIYHTNDLHSHLEGVTVVSGDHYERRGGFARLTTVIKAIREQKKDEIIIGVDAGDFFAGTIFSGLALATKNDFPELQFFSENKFDLVTLGNHEFDGRNEGLGIMFEKALRLFPSVPLISTNIKIKGDSPLSKYIGKDRLIKPLLVKEFKSSKGNLKIGFLGILGPDGCLVSRSTRGDISFVGFDESNSDQELGELADFLNPLIKELKEVQKVDVVILSMHGGGKESIKLARALKGLDVLIAGHTHKVEFSQVGDVIINQTGSYGENLGFLELGFDAVKRKVILLDPQKSPLIKITAAVKPDPVWQKRVEEWRQKSFQLMGHKKEKANEVVFTPKNSYIRSNQIPNPMGKLVTNSILAELNEGVHFDNVDVYMTSMGLVRTSLHKNIPYTRAEIFEVVSIGFDEKLRPGVDIVSFYLSPKDMELVVNFMELYSHISTSFSPAISSSLDFKIRKWGIPFINRIHEVKLKGVELKKIDSLIKVATNRYLIDNIETVKIITRGLIEIVPKNASGVPLKVFPIHGKEYQQLTEHFKKHGGKY